MCMRPWNFSCHVGSERRYQLWHIIPLSQIYTMHVHTMNCSTLMAYILFPFCCVYKHSVHNTVPTIWKRLCISHDEDTKKRKAGKVVMTKWKWVHARCWCCNMWKKASMRTFYICLRRVHWHPHLLWFCSALLISQGNILNYYDALYHSRLKGKRDCFKWELYVCAINTSSATQLLYITIHMNLIWNFASL